MIRKIDEEKFEELYDFANEANSVDDRAERFLGAWKNVWSLMIRENNFSDSFNSEVIDWQVMNLANDTTIALSDAKHYQELITVNKQILEIDWGEDHTLMVENAKRDLADAYASVGDYEKCIELYEDYLDKDPLWGWAWIGYFRQLHENADEKFVPTITKLVDDLEEGKEFRDKVDLVNEIINELKDSDDDDEFAKRALIVGSYCLQQVINEREEELDRLKVQMGLSSRTVIRDEKIYPNDPCPCGSGKKYKKCCGRNK